MPTTGWLHGPQSVSYWGASVPPTFVSLSAANWVGFAFNVSAPLKMQGIRFYVPSGSSGPRIGVVWSSGGDGFRARWFDYDGSLPGQWNQCWFRPWFLYDFGADCRVAVLTNGGYYRTANKFSSGSVTQNGIVGIKGFQTTAIDPTVASLTFNNNANGVDILGTPA